MDTVFDSLKALVEEYLDFETELTEAEVMKRVEDAYEADDINGREYDELMSMFD